MSAQNHPPVCGAFRTADTSEGPPSGPIPDPSVDSARAAAKRRSGSLSTMLLPDLQQLAGSLGIASGKLRKSDLVTAIQNAQRGNAAATKPDTAKADGPANGAASAPRTRSR